MRERRERRGRAGPIACGDAIDCGMSDDSGHASRPMAPPAGADESRSARKRWIILAVVLLLAVYIASPYYAFWRFTVALRTGDAEALQSHVDFPSLRKSMKQQLNAKLGSLRPQNPKRQKMFDTLSDAFGSRVVDSLVDAYLTPEGLAAFLNNPRLPNEVSPPPAGAAPPSDDPSLIAPETSGPEAATPPRIDWSRVRYAFFTGPRDFLVDVEGTKLRFRFTGLRWKLRALELDVEKLKLNV